MTNEEKILKEFVHIERQKMRTGSGDDGWFEQQIINFADKNKDFLIELIKFVKDGSEADR